MPRPFADTTAELVVQVVDAVQAQGKARPEDIESFCDLSHSQVENALFLAQDLRSR